MNLKLNLVLPIFVFAEENDMQSSVKSHMKVKANHVCC